MVWNFDIPNPEDRTKPSMAISNYLKPVTKTNGRNDHRRMRSIEPAFAHAAEEAEHLCPQAPVLRLRQLGIIF